MKTQDHFALFGLTKHAKAPEIKKTYYDYAKIFHPDKLPTTASQELVDLTRQVFSQFTKAYEILSDEHRKAEYIKEREKGHAEKILQAEAILEEGKGLLKSNQYVKAKQKFEQAMVLRPPTTAAQ